MARFPRPIDTVTPFPTAPLMLPIPEIDDDTWEGLGRSAWQTVNTARGARTKYDQALDIWNAMYDMRTVRRQVPWPGAANISLPTLRAACDELVSRVSGSVFQERLFTVAGTDPTSSGYAHSVEQFFNGEFDENMWQDALDECIELAARDGLGWAEVWWDLSVVEELRYETQSNTNLVGVSKQKRVPKMVKMVKYDAPRVGSVEARDMIVLPSHWPDAQTAPGVARKVFMSEADMWKMVNAGIFREDKTEYILSYSLENSDERPRDPQGIRTWTISGLIDVTNNTVSAPDVVHMERGAVEMWRINTRQYDINNDKKWEENVLWVHEASQCMAGFAPFEYWGYGDLRRPYFPLSLFTRTKRIYGFGAMQLGRSVIEEKNAIENAYLDYLDIATQALPMKTKQAKFQEENKRWGFDNMLEVTDLAKDFGFAQPPALPQGALQERENLDNELNRVMTAPTAPATQAPVGGTQQRSARAAQLDAELRSAMQNSVIRRTRRWMLDIFKYLVSLYRQYGPDDLETVAPQYAGNSQIRIPKAILSLPYKFGIVGMGGPLDKAQRRQDMLQLGEFLMQTPLVQGNIARIWTICRLIVETYDIPEVTALIGSMQDANQQQQAMGQQQQQQQKIEILKALLSHTNTKASLSQAQKPGGQNGQSNGQSKGLSLT